jgi:hypothetical protein
MFIPFVASEVLKEQDNVNTAAFIIGLNHVCCPAQVHVTRNSTSVYHKKIKIRQLAPTQYRRNPHKIVTKFQLETSFVFASARLALKIDYVI